MSPEMDPARSVEAVSDPSELELAWLESAGEEFRVEKSLTALSQALYFAHRAVEAFIAREIGEGFTHLQESLRAADQAMDPGSPEVESFGVVAAFIADGPLKGAS